ncbi:MAG: glycosyltransferase family 4 protein [Candidatus Acidiferrales bacterium]
MQKERVTRLLLVGPTPPPYNGMSVATEMVKRALHGVIDCIHLDTADRRGLANVGKLDFTNVFLALFHGMKFLWILLSDRPASVYVPISQLWLPFLRDCLFLVPARLLNRDVIIHLHGSYFRRFYIHTSPIMRAIVHYALGNVMIAIVLGENVANVFDGILPPDRIRIIPNGVPDTLSGQAAKNAKQTNGFAPVVLYLSTLAAGKGFSDILRALPGVRDRVGSVRAVFAGEWYSRQDKDMADELIESLGLQAVVEFTGPVDPEQRAQLLEKASVFVLPSRNEGQPYAILEAMAARLPIISTKIGCIPETVRDNVEGFLIEPGDIETLARKISDLLLDPRLLQRMGEASRRRFLDCYTYERFAEKIRAVFASPARTPCLSDSTGEL